MQPKTRLSLVALTVLAAAFDAAAQDRVRSDITRDDIAKSATRLTGTVAVGQALNLPNLHLSGIGIHDWDFQITVDVTNNGQAASPASDLTVTVALINPHTGQKQGASRTLKRPVPAFAPGASQRLYVGLVELPNRSQDWDLGIEAVVDPVNSVVEGNERDNSRYYTCRMAGPNPAQGAGVPPPC